MKDYDSWKLDNPYDGQGELFEEEIIISFISNYDSKIFEKMENLNEQLKDWFGVKSEMEDDGHEIDDETCYNIFTFKTSTEKESKLKGIEKHVEDEMKAIQKQFSSIVSLKVK